MATTMILSWMVMMGLHMQLDAGKESHFMAIFYIKLMLRCKGKRGLNLVAQLSSVEN